jgi:high-affinity nickel-transport protein
MAHSAAQVLIEQTNLRGGFFAAIASVDLNTVGYIVVSVFVLTWVIALVSWRVGKFEEKWTVALLRLPIAGNDDIMDCEMIG